jgi:nicotinamidase-related amidase
VARQGCPMSEREVLRIISLLKTTELTLVEIATRMCCSHTAIVAVNRKYRVRIYGGLRRRWHRRAEQASQ